MGRRIIGLDAEVLSDAPQEIPVGRLVINEPIELLLTTGQPPDSSASVARADLDEALDVAERAYQGWKGLAAQRQHGRHAAWLGAPSPQAPPMGYPLR